jgi:hypothetical protein
LNIAATGIIIIYAVLTYLLVNAVRSPTVFSVDEHRNLTRRPAFKTYKEALPSGTVISVSAEEVSVHLQFEDMPTTIRRGKSTVFKIPGGVESVKTGTFNI